MSQRKIMSAILALVIILSIVPSAFARQTASGAAVGLSVAQTKFSAQQDVLVSVTLSNPTDKAMQVLKWYTPVAGVEEDLFMVRRDGGTLTYMGGHYKRPAPTAADYVQLAPGASVVREVNLGAYYDFSTSATYTIRFASGSFNLYGTGTKGDGSLLSNELTIWVEGRASASTADFGMPALDGVTAGTTSFNRCTTTQQSQLLTARTNASSYSANALSYMGGSVGTRYISWFGALNSGRQSTVTSHYTAIKNAMDNANITFDCGCKKTYYAYVYPNQPYTIYLCKAFWTAPATGTDSKAGTLIHEMSHFTVVAGTDDHVYGQTGARSLAISNPTNAVDNADNHEYFAENTPFEN